MNRSKNPLLYVIWSDPKKKAFLLFTSFFFGFLASGGEALSFFFLQLAFSDMSRSAEIVFPLEGLSFFSFLLLSIGCQIFRSGNTFFSNCFWIRFLVRAHHSVQAAVSERIFRFSFSCVHQFQKGKFTETATLPLHSLRPALESLYQMVFSFMFCLILGAFLFRTSVSLTLLLFLLFGVLGGIYRMLAKWVSAFSKKYSDSVANLTQDIAEQIGAMRLIHSCQRGSVLEGKLKEKHSATFSSLKQLMDSSNFFVYSFEALSLFGILCLLAVGKVILSSDQTPLLLAFMGAGYRFGTRAQGFILHLSQFLSYSGALRRLSGFLETKDKHFLPLSELRFSSWKDEICFEKVWLKYPHQNSFALQEISFSVRKGSTVALVGQSGSGKSSLMDLLLRLYSPTKGNICIDGKAISQFDLQSWCDQIGVVSQETILFNTTIEENLLFKHPKVSWEKVEEIAKQTGIDSFIKKLPHGYQTILGDRGVQLSGGQKQRLAIARALIGKPSILIFDEATSHLDSQTERVIEKCFAFLKKESTIFFIAHRLSSIVHADQIYLFENGEIIEEGTHRALIHKNQRYGQFWKEYANV